MADDTDNAPSGLDAETAAYFESRGEKLPVEKPVEQAQIATEKPADAISADRAAQAAVEGDKQPTTVPLRALQEEREEKKALRAEREEMARKLAVLEDRWATLLNMQEQQPKADADPEPDPQKDIFAHNAWLARQLAREREFRETNAKQTAEQRQAAEYQGKVWNLWNSDAATYRAQNADFGDVVKWMSETRAGQLKALAGINPQFQSDAGINAQIEAELFDLVVRASQAGISPAKYVHDLGKSWGYKAAAPAADPAKVIEQANKNADAEKSLSQLGGSANPGPKTAEDVAAMSPDDFEKWLTKNPKGFKRLFGG